MVALVDPASDAGQRIGPAIALLMDNAAVSLSLILNPSPKAEGVPVKRFYRTVSPAISFFGNGTLNAGPRAVFSNLPRSSLLTLGLETPASWMVQSVASQHDLDNIHLESSHHNVAAVFQLGAFFVCVNVCGPPSFHPPACVMHCEPMLAISRVCPMCVPCLLR